MRLPPFAGLAATLLLLAAPRVAFAEGLAAAVAAEQASASEAAAVAAAPLEPAELPGEIALGRWAGSADLGSGAEPGSQSEPMVLRVLEAGGLLDLPARGIFGFPLPYFERGPRRLSFSFSGTGGESGFEAKLEEARAAAGGRLVGRYRGADGTEGTFALELRPLPQEGEPYAIETGRGPAGDPTRGMLSGTLLLPEGESNGVPVALLLAGAGPVDRDGNSYLVPGKCDSLAALAEALAACGVASLRYDKRGSGEAYALVRREEDLVFGDYVADAVDALRALASDGRFASVVVAGHGEGAVVGAAALADFLARGLADGRDGRFSLALLCAPEETALETIERELSALPEDQRLEAAAILESLREGRMTERPSPALSDFFRPSIQPYLSSELGYDLAAQLRRTTRPLLLIRGGRDAEGGQVGSGRLAATRPDAAVAVLEDMGRALKDLGPDPDDAYRALSDPSMPLAAGLADLIAAFARGEAVSAGGPAPAAATAEPAEPADAEAAGVMEPAAR